VNRVKTQSVLLTAVLALAIYPIAGCGIKANAPLPKNAINQTDAEIFRSVADAAAFLNSLDSSVKSGKLVLTPEENAIRLQANKDVNLAETR
jgi:hypothetical protein